MKDILPIEIIPDLSKKCKISAMIIALFLLLFPIVSALFFWYLYDHILIAFFLFIFLQFVSGVIASKMRIVSIAFDQINFDYSTYEIAKWYIYKHFCPKDDNLLDKKNY